ncbi:MAG TPA: tetratricopeptide repeat protein [Rhizomicrobium sp.]
MHRLLVRLGALALSTAALAACASDPAIPSLKQAKNDAAAGTTPSLEGDIRTAQVQRASGDYTGAIRSLSQLMLVAPDDPRVVGEYGKVLVQQGRGPEALNFLKRAIELQPGDWTLYSALGVTYDQIKDPVKARDAYQRALVLKPGEAAVLNNFALSRMLAGDPAQAKTLMAQAAASGSNEPKIAHNLALIDGLAGPKAPPAVQSDAPAATPQATTAPAAEHPPTPLSMAKSDGTAGPTTTFMQQVPYDPQAGPVGKPAKAAPRKLAKAPLKTPAETVKSTIPALRLANDNP